MSGPAQQPDVRVDNGQLEKDFDGLSSTFSKDGQSASDISPAEDRRLYRLVVKRVLVIMLGTYFLQSLDKGTMSFAAIMNIRQDTGMVGQEYAWLTTILYLGILVMEWPVSIIVQKYPVGRYLGFSIMAWGAVLAGSAASHSWGGLMAARFLLGDAMTGIQQAVGGVMSFGVSHIKHGPLHSWQVLFIALGCFTILWGLFVIWWLPDSPMRATCFSEEDRKLLLERVRGNQTGVQNKTWKREQVLEALKDPQVWALCLMQILNTVPTGGFGAFGNIIINAFGYTVLQTSLLSIAQGGIHIAIVTSSAYIAQRYQQTIGVAFACILPSVSATIVMMTVQTSPSNRFFFNGQAVMIFSLLSRNIGGQTKKTFVIALSFVYAPRYRKGFSVHLGFYGCQALTLAALRWWYSRQNAAKAQRRIAKHGEAAEATENLDEAFNDLTDRENDQFRYVV
ncbi:hypothetical protein RQP46_001792 [Phenoliferia psychrophenolica]